MAGKRNTWPEWACLCWSGALCWWTLHQTDQRMRDAAGLRDRLPLQSLQGVKVLDFSAFLVKPVKQVELYDGLAAALGDREAEAPPMACLEASVGNDTGIGAACAGARILLVEDNSVNQAVATKLLEKMGGHVTLAANGEEAFKSFSENRFDLLLMDVQMPVMDGSSVTELIR